MFLLFLFSDVVVLTFFSFRSGMAKCPGDNCVTNSATSSVAFGVLCFASSTPGSGSGPAPPYDLYAYNSTNGALLWVAATPELVQFAPVITTDSVFAVSGSTLFEFDLRTGNLQQKVLNVCPSVQPNAYNAYFASAPVFVKGVVIVSCTNGDMKGISTQ